MTAVVLVLVGVAIGAVTTNAVWRRRAEDHNWQVTWLQWMDVRGICAQADHDHRTLTRIVEAVPDDVLDDVLPPSTVKAGVS